MSNNQSHSLSELQSGQLKGIKRLTLSDHLTSFPLEILTLAETLEVLDLSNNQLSSLPDEIKKLHKLKIIFASKNKFEHLPEVLGQCPNLEMVGFKSNKIKQVSEHSLPEKLRWLILTDNQIESLPERLGERPRLQKLALAGNRLKQLPQSLSQAKNLELIRISANQLAEFPQHLFELPKLAWLAFSGNPFSEPEDNQHLVPEVSSSSYQLQQVLGQGASGVISKAKWRQPQEDFPEDVAVKVFKGEVTSDGYPADELQACLSAGYHPNLVRPLAQVNEQAYLALIMELIPANYNNLGLPPSLETCTRDTFPEGFRLSITKISKMVQQMQEVFEHLHANKVSHGDLYAHNTLFDEQANILFGDFGAATIYSMLTSDQQLQIQRIEKRALNHFIADLLSVCTEVDKSTEEYQLLSRVNA